MAAPGGLEQWQKDGFFQAAEEVQESAGFDLVLFWLEQFERAVSSSNDKYSLEEGTVARRRQFIVAIEDQISRVEREINGSSIDNGKRGLNWVKLDDEERDDLVAFLSAPAEFFSQLNSTDSSYHIPSRQKNVPIGMNDHEDAALIVKDIHEVPSRQISSVKSDICGLADQLHGHRSNLGTGDGHWKIDIGNEIDEKRKLSSNGVQASSQTTSLSGIRRSTESLTRVRWFWNSLWKPKSDEHRPLRYDMPNNIDLRVLSLLTQVYQFPPLH
ncbi:hypothetical protein HU200_011470 [Digitaria exilis]|uniref:Syntaxin 6 N-terminal domain-containing protein n=1 Tax=Digitaria exilis TaxID=1010633 RepID=A0A835FG88_9POAL|nr:hypothetical protein HU200_011470 [Digitaria exilis]